ncbi:MAG: bifunctional 4-hydroxy-2-oxoglutarate aldolase/2-dehydro-3-deoxy-phosphogluconate aldolase [Aphanocapsa sp. GSE-SYN-MK-11-07L]|nr:bifunctional 4-hydroxy-2-oxoglutarate aldolase/2-dehydro-3-deoxy-phosphogluconate aldolase [Aphanocapsa sp. GSE-SYN-MK-11-07L]
MSANFSYRQAWLNLLRQHRAIAVIRSPNLDLGRQIAQAIAAGGIRLIEITWTSDRPAELIAQLRQDLPECQIGAGTLLDCDQMQQAIAAGASFLFSPHFQLDLVKFACDRQVPVVPGCLSPTEIIAAWQAGASSVKVFPIQSMGGCQYLQALQAPLAGIPLIPTGGVTLANARAFVEAGAIGVGLASDLFPPDLIKTENWAGITQRAKLLVQSLVL